MSHSIRKPFGKFHTALSALAIISVHSGATAKESQALKAVPMSSSTAANLVKLTDQANKLRGSFEDETAIKLYTNVLSINSSFGPALYGRAKSFEALGKYPQAVDDLKKCQYSDDAVGPTATRELATLLLALKQYAQSLAVWDRLINELNVKTDGAYSGRGEVYQALHRYPEAIADYTAAYKNKNRPGLLSKRALAYLSNKQYKQCIADCTNCLSSDTDATHSARNNAEVYTMRADAYAAIGQSALALKDRATAKSSVQGNFDIAPFSDKHR